jgi:hypothetical protein
LPIYVRIKSTVVHALMLPHTLLVRLSDLDFNVPASDVYTDPGTAIRVLWSKDGRNVELVFPSAEGDVPYLYHSNDTEYGVVENPAPEVTRNWLMWVLQYDGLEPIRIS